MKIDKYLKENKGRSFDLPFSINQDPKLIKELINNCTGHNFHSRSNANNIINQRHILLPLNFKQEMP